MKNTLTFAIIFITLAVILLVFAIAMSFKTLYLGNTNIYLLQGFLIFGASIYGFIGNQLARRYIKQSN